ncbi:YaiI/YqxD family protein [Gracilinema caldarium]|uniref:UPF0178 protein Spica_1703 n=1 Tax=Gracilinema caldarium (strain ATCC 51460 / DSM 7334 / H1) TaxID=744872 RepID=F8F1Z9_GRAC1|nr:DUF188 domain-containing protein [Gracilinema caldarium]AEJ19846.1 UPF0178 protein yaiI [Gracilinema caldarium DSM 7334]
MKILVDADSCPKSTRETIIRALKRTGIQGIFTANRPIPGIPSDGICKMELCKTYHGAADDRIVELAEPGDLVITRDIPLASRLVEAHISVLDDRGRLYTKENIRERLSLRDFMVGLAEQGLGPERIANYGKKELKAFADGFDRELQRLIRQAQDTYPGSV